MKNLFREYSLLVAAFHCFLFIQPKSFKKDPSKPQVSKSKDINKGMSEVGFVKESSGVISNKKKLQKQPFSNKTKIIFKKAKIKLKRKKSLFPKGRIKNFPWRKGRPVITKKLKPPKGKLPGKYDYQNEVNPNWEMSFREKLSENLEGQKVEIDKKNSVIIANGNKAIFAEEVGVTVGDDGNEVRMIIDSENGEVVHSSEAQAVVFFYPAAGMQLLEVR